MAYDFLAFICGLVKDNLIAYSITETVNLFDLSPTEMIYCRYSIQQHFKNGFLYSSRWNIIFVIRQRNEWATKKEHTIIGTSAKFVIVYTNFCGYCIYHLNCKDIKSLGVALVFFFFFWWIRDAITISTH